MNYYVTLDGRLLSAKETLEQNEYGAPETFDTDVNGAPLISVVEVGGGRLEAWYMIGGLWHSVLLPGGWSLITHDRDGIAALVDEMKAFYRDRHAEIDPADAIGPRAYWLAFLPARQE